MIKVYIHNFFSEQFFLTIAHNSINRIYNIDKSENTGNVICEYNNVSFDFVFNPELNDNSDGVHIIDFFSIFKNYNQYKNFNDLTFEDSITLGYGKNKDIKIIRRIIELISNKKDWIFLYLRTEKILAKTDIPSIELSSTVDELLQQLQNHKIISDNVFLNDQIESQYPNFFHAFTNTIYNWNDLIGIRWFYEFKHIFENLNKPYDIGFSMKRIKRNRKQILKLLKEQNNQKIFLSFTDHRIDSQDLFDKNINTLLVDGITYNTIRGNNDFENMQNINNLQQVGLDLFFRILSKSKVQILDESWAWLATTFTHQYISEKTIGYVLAGIPFISTHTYPLDILQKVLGLEKHPFYNEINESYNDSVKFCNFVKEFLENFDKNHLLCVEWSKIAHEKMLEKILSKNDLLDLIQNNFKRNDIIVSRSLI